MSHIKRKFQTNSQTTVIIRKKMKKNRTHLQHYNTIMDKLWSNLDGAIDDSSLVTFGHLMTSLVMVACSDGESQTLFIFDVSKIVTGYLTSKCPMLDYLERKQLRHKYAISQYFDYIGRSKNLSNLADELVPLTEFIQTNRVVEDGYKILHAAHQLSGEDTDHDLIFCSLLDTTERCLLYRSWLVTNNYTVFVYLKPADMDDGEVFAIDKILSDTKLFDKTTMMARIALLSIWNQTYVDAGGFKQFNSQVDLINENLEHLWTQSIRDNESFCVWNTYAMCLSTPNIHTNRLRRALEHKFRTEPIASVYSTYCGYSLFWKQLYEYLGSSPLGAIVKKRYTDWVEAMNHAK